MKIYDLSKQRIGHLITRRIEVNVQYRCIFTQTMRCVQNLMRWAKNLNNGACYRGGVKTNVLETSILCIKAFERAQLRSAV
jgi:hypothetical protein